MGHCIRKPSVGKLNIVIFFFSCFSFFCTVTVQYYSQIPGIVKHGTLLLHTSSERHIGKERAEAHEIADTKLISRPNVCSSARRMEWLTPDNLNHFQYKKSHKLFYCGIEKTGSTFWRRFFQHLHRDVVENPYKIKPQDCMLHYRSLHGTSNSTFNDLLQDAYKFMFVREPYGRLLSGYIDKIFSPNPFYWNALGKYIISKYRNKKSQSIRSKMCGDDVSFQEFIDYVIGSETSGIHRDGHFMLASDVCKPCLINYTFVGRMESFAKDVFHILEKTNLAQYKDKLKNMKQAAADDAIYDVVQAYIAMRGSAHRCLTPHVALLRVWRKLQIRGFIGKSIPCPVDPKQVHRLSERQLLRIVKEAQTKSDPVSLKLQKKEMLVHAYRHISDDKMKILSEVFKTDFDVFNYDPYPSVLFKRTSGKRINLFNVYANIS